MKPTVSNKISVYNYIFTLLMVLYHCRATNIENIVFANDFNNWIYNTYIKYTDHLGFTVMTFFS